MRERTSAQLADAAMARILLRGTRLDLRDRQLVPADRALLMRRCGELDERLARLEHPQPELVGAR